MKLQTLRDANMVKRYHTEVMLKEETVGHHCANVACTVIYMYHHVYKQLPPGSLLTYIALHDVEELETGDLPAPVKWHRPELKEKLNLAAEQVRQGMDLPVISLSAYQKNVAKFADLFDVMCKFMEERRMGCHTHDAAIDRIIMKLTPLITGLPPEFKVVAQELVLDLQGEFDA